MLRTAVLIAMVIVASAPLRALPPASQYSFHKVQMIERVGDRTETRDVRVNFGDDALQVVSRKDGLLIRTIRYADIRRAEYSYSKVPRWKTGLGLGIAGVILPPLWLIALPLGFSKHRRHWFTVVTDSDFAVLKLSKSERKLFIPAFETRSRVEVIAVGEDK